MSEQESKHGKGWLMYRCGKGLEDSDVQSGVSALCCKNSTHLPYDKNMQ